MNDLDVYNLIKSEETRQSEGLELIPSENYASKEVRDALASVFTNKYSEGYPAKRYYGGQEFTDKLERIAISRAKEIFRADHANVQPHSGAQANQAAYHAWMEPGDKILAMALDQGGHLTHGHPVTMLAERYQFLRYGIKDVETGEIDYENLYETAKKHKPKIILAGFSAYTRELDYQKFAYIAEEIGAVPMADIAHLAGLIAGGVLKNPFDYGFKLVTSTTHKTLRGPRGGLILSRGELGNPLKAPTKTVKNLPTLIDRSVFPGNQGGPHMNSIAAKAVCFYEAMQPEFCIYAKRVVENAKVLADELMKLGCKLVTNGTDNHMMLINIKASFNINGAVAEKALETAGITANKNVIPFDTEPPFSPSGLRLGTPALTTRGMNTSDMQKVASLIVNAIKSHANDKGLSLIRDQVKELAHQFPIPN